MRAMCSIVTQMRAGHHRLVVKDDPFLMTLSRLEAQWYRIESIHAPSGHRMTRDFYRLREIEGWLIGLSIENLQGWKPIKEGAK